MLSVHSPSGEMHCLSSFPLKKSQQIQAIWISGNNALQRKEALRKNAVTAAASGLH